MTYDGARHRVVMFGGAGAAGALGDTWTWDGTGWTLLQPAASPPARSDAAMAYDAADREVVLFGGSDAIGDALGDTWTWDGSNWTEQHPDHSPSAREAAAMTYDSATTSIVLFGGLNPAVLDGTWKWNGYDWTERAVSGITPGGRDNSAMAYFPRAHAAVLFGGYTDYVLCRQWPPICTHHIATLDDTWRWDGTKWTRRAPATRPASRDSAAMVFDPPMGKVLMFGGTGEGGNPSGPVYDDTLAWDGHDWTVLHPTTSPAKRQGAGIAYDAATREVVMFGGAGSSFHLLSGTWTWDGSNWSRE
jgi:hypothetical protein